MDKRYQVFVSSTYLDLLEERQSVMQTLMKMDCIPAGMELFPAADEAQWEFIKKVIDDCDYYLLIIGGRYGSLSSEGLSYTEKEFDYAVEKGIRVIALLHKNPSVIPSGKTELDPKLRKKLEVFRKKVSTNRLVDFWEDSSSLSGKVALGLINATKMYPAVGWVRADQVSNTELLNEINELRKTKEHLENENESLKKKNEGVIFSQQEEKEFLSIYSELRGAHEAFGTLYYKAEGNNPQKTTLCIVTYSLLRALKESTLEDTYYSPYRILDSFETEIEQSENFKNEFNEGDSVTFIRVKKEIKGLLKIKGFVVIHFALIEQRMLSPREKATYLYSDKMYRFIYWLNFYNKLESEPRADFKKIAESSEVEKDDLEF